MLKVVKALIIFFVVLCIGSQAKSQNHAEVIYWLDQNVIKIKTVEAGNDFNDLMPMKEFLKEARIVALGEATHGTKEFFQMKHRMLEFLVKEMGFRCFAMEANFTESFAVNDYVMHGKGDPQKALKGLYFWTWDTKEVLAMLLWMRDYNKDKQDKEKVRFYGFDMQTPQVASRELQKYLLQVDSGFAAIMLPLFNNIKKIPEGPDSSFISRHITKNAELLKVIRERFDKEKNLYTGKSDQNEFKVAWKNMDLIAQYFELISAKGENAQAQVRDRCMSENVKWLLNHEGDSTKFVLWAHNGHIAKDVIDRDGLTMGYHLSKFYGKQYYALCFDFYKGGFQAMDPAKGPIEYNYELNKNSTGYIFSKARYDNFFFDFQKAFGKKEVKQFLNDSIPSICIGALFSNSGADSFYIKSPLAKIYDGMIFIRNTHRAEPNSGSGVFDDFGNMMSRVPAEKYAGKEFKFSAWLKVGKETSDGQGQLWSRVDKKDKSMGFFDNMSDRPVTSKDWNYCEINGLVDKDATFLYFGSMLIGTGELFVDDISLSYKENDQWFPIELPDPTFENGEVGKKPETWYVWDKTYKILVTDETSHGGKKSLKFEKQ
ncbi:MAG: erythromycin esterase family protein [Bacteroidota bacterium]